MSARPVSDVWRAADAALEAAMLEWYGAEMRRAIEAANAVTRAALRDKP